MSSTGVAPASEVGGASTVPGDGLVFGDDQGNLYFVAGATGQVVATQQLLYGNVLTPPTLQNGIAYCAGSNPGSTGTVNVYVANSGAQVGQGPIQLDASVDASPVLSGTTLYAATASGRLFAFDVSAPATPSQLWNLDVMGLGTARTVVSALLLAQGGRTLVMVTHNGVYAVDVSRTGNPAKLWSSSTSTAFDQAPPLLTDGGVLYAAAGSTLYCWNLATAPVNGSLSPAWQFASPSGQTLGRPWRLAFGQILIGDVAGAFWAVDVHDRTRVTALSLAATGVSAQRATLYGSLLLLTSTTGDVWAYRVSVGTSGTAVTQAWHVSLSVPTPTAPDGHLLVGPTSFGPIVFVPSTNGSLHALNAATGASVWPAATLGTTGATTFGRSAFDLPTQSTAAVQFVLDGENYFLALRDLLVASAYGTFQGGPLPNSATLRTFIRFIGSKGGGLPGHSAFVLLWNPSLAFAKALAAWEKVTGGGVGLNLAANRSTAASLPTTNVEVKLESYAPSWLYYGGSQHQKIAIFQIAGVKVALVGGLNLSDEYWDTSAHPMSSHDLSSWHDTAVILQGDAAALVEREFDRRWAKLSDGAPPVPKDDTYAKLAFWEMERDTRADEYWVTNGTQAATPYRSRSVPSSPVPVSVMTTDYNAPAVTQVRDGLVAAIANAAQYAYFENCGFYDATLTRALAAKYASPSSQFHTIIMVPQPTANPGTIQSAYFALSKAAWSALLLAMGTWDSVTVQAGQIFPFGPTVSRSNCTAWWIDWSDSIERTRLWIRYPGYANPYSALVTQITDVATSESRVTFCGPARYFATPPATDEKKITTYASNYRFLYVHSKLALFDDQTAFVGSANFTERSMIYDGELSVAISDGPTVQGIRQSLFSHWNMTTAAQWAQGMSAFASTQTDGVGVLPQTLSALPNKSALPFAAWAMTAFSEV